MKKAISLIAVLLVALTAVAVSLVTCDEQSQNVRLAMNAMDSGDYERALRLYSFARERGETSSEDERIYEILSAYIDASRCLRSEDFAEGLDILDACNYDYSELSIRSDMDELYTQLSEGKYADERINILSEAVNAQDYERAKTLADEIGTLSLTSAQQDRLYSLSRVITNNTASDGEIIIYYVNRSSDTDIPMYFEPDEESDELCCISGGEAVEVRAFAEDGFIEIFYDGMSGYVQGSLLSAEMPGSDSDEDDGGNADSVTDENETESTENNGNEAENDTNETGTTADTTDEETDSEEESVPVEAISEGDTLYALTGVNMRTEPNTDCEVIDVVPGGAEVTYLGEMEHGFYKVAFNGKEGYVYSDYVQK